MKPAITAVLLFSLCGLAQDEPKRPPEPAFGAAASERFARLALACVHKEYPNKISHVMNGDADVAPARQLTPAFFGCYDWHSSVHGHWLLARLARLHPDAPYAEDARNALERSLSAANIAKEVAYLKGAGRASFERPYGLAWLLTLSQELREWDNPWAEELSERLRPLEQAAIERLSDWLPKLSHPVRIGEHNQTAFGLGLMLDWARAAGHREFERLLIERTRRYYIDDQKCPLAYEPSGEDFLSPCLGEADVMRRILRPAEFAEWLRRFLPEIPTDGTTSWLAVAVVTDPSDPKLAHLDGLNLSRAWMLEGIVSGLPPSDKRVPTLKQTAAAHRAAGLKSVTGAHYEGGHWLGSFATYLVTGRGVREQSQR